MCTTADTIKDLRERLQHQTKLKEARNETVRGFKRVNTQLEYEVREIRQENKRLKANLELQETFIDYLVQSLNNATKQSNEQKKTIEEQQLKIIDLQDDKKEREEALLKQANITKQQEQRIATFKEFVNEIF